MTRTVTSITLPNFIHIGPSRTGTTTLYFALRQHPDIYMSPVKEPHFMAYDPAWLAELAPIKKIFEVQTLPRYAALFAGATGERAIGEASPAYFVAPPAPGNIRRHVPDARLITILRHPVDRCYSHYMLYWLQGEEPRSLMQALADSTAGVKRPLRLGQHWYVKMGFYHQHLQRYWQLFPREQVGIWLFDELQAQPQQLVRSIFAFLEVDDTFLPDISVKHNPSGVPRSMTLNWLLKKRWWTVALRQRLPWRLIGRPYSKLMRIKEENLTKPPLEPEVRQRLLALYREETLRLQDALQRDLSAWLV